MGKWLVTRTNEDGVSAVTSSEQQWDVVSSVGLTALGVAAARAVETHHAQALVQDPLAERFVEAANPPKEMPTRPDSPVLDSRASSSGWFMMADFLGVRSRFLDEVVDEATSEGVDQVVVLAAGLDARAYRMSLPSSCHLYEVDQPRVLEFKDEVLGDSGARASCPRHVVATDLRDDWAGALRAAGFDPGRPAVWLVEGLLPYLPAEAEQQLFDRIDEFSPSGSRIGVERVRDAEAMVRKSSFREFSGQFGADVGALWNREPRRPAEDRLRSSGWQVDCRTVAEVARSYGREINTDARELVGQHGLLMSGTRA